MGAGPGADEEDPVVRELPVYVCNEFLGSVTQLCLFQHPLRPPWRPYEYHKAKHIRMKPNTKRVEVDLPLDVESRNYNDIIEDFKKVNNITLRSTQVDAKTALALGTIQDGKLLLAPLDYSIQLRPNLSHLNVGNQKKGNDDEEEDSDDEPTMLRAVEVQVQKRETERQQQARLNSFAYISQKEEEESWINLALHTADSRPAESIWGRFMAAKDNDIKVDMDRSDYLRAFVPSANQPVGPATTFGTGATPMELDGNSLDQAVKLTEEQSRALTATMRVLFASHSVCTMANIRQWLNDPSSNAGVAKEAAIMPDRALHEVLMDTGLLVCIRRMYLMRAVGNTATDPFRAVVLELLKERESFKRSEVVDTAQAQGINVTDTLYNKVVKDLCTSRGHLWSLRNGADM